MNVSAYPWARVRRVARADVELIAAATRRLPLGVGSRWHQVAAGLGGLDLRLEEIRTAREGDLAELARGGVVLRLSASHGRWALLWIEEQLAARLARAALGTPTEELAAPRPPTLAEIGALRFLAGELAGDAADVLGVVPAAELSGAARATGSVVVLEARVSHAGRTAPARLVLPDAMLAVPQPAAGLPDLGRLAGAEIEAAIEIGRAMLSPTEAAGLGPGDVVIVAPAGPSLPARLRIGRGGFASVVSADRLTITGHFATVDAKGARMATDDLESARTAELLGELPAEVVCELGRVRLSAREVLELKPGAIVPLDKPLEGPIELTIGGRAIAHGELVSVDGQLGVRIQTLK